MKNKYGANFMDRVIAQQIKEYTFNNKADMANELYKLHSDI